MIAIAHEDSALQRNDKRRVARHAAYERHADEGQHLPVRKELRSTHTIARLSHWQIPLFIGMTHLGSRVMLAVILTKVRTASAGAEGCTWKAQSTARPLHLQIPTFAGMGLQFYI